MTTVGIDIGAYQHAVALCRDGAVEADRRILRLVDIGFPELRVAYDDPGCASAIALLRVAPTARAAAARHGATLAKARTSGGRVVGRKKAEQIHTLARTTVAAPELDAQVAFEMELP